MNINMDDAHIDLDVLRRVDDRIAKIEASKHQGWMHKVLYAEAAIDVLLDINKTTQPLTNNLESAFEAGSYEKRESNFDYDLGVPLTMNTNKYGHVRLLRGNVVLQEEAWEAATGEGQQILGRYAVLPPTFRFDSDAPHRGQRHIIDPSRPLSMMKEMPIPAANGIYSDNIGRFIWNTLREEKIVTAELVYQLWGVEDADVEFMIEDGLQDLALFGLCHVYDNSDGDLVFIKAEE